MTGFTTSQIYVNKSNNYGNIVIEESTTGLLPALKVVYEDGTKYLAIIPRAHFFSFEAQEIQFVVEQFIWNDKFSRWDATDSGKFNSSMVTVSNRFIVDQATGKGQTEMTLEEQEGKTFIGEYLFWLANLGKTVILPQLLLALKKKFEFVPAPVVIPEMPPIPSGNTDPSTSGSTDPSTSGTTEPSTSGSTEPSTSGSTEPATSGTTEP